MTPHLSFGVVTLPVSCEDLADNVSQFLLAVLAGDGKQGDTVITVARVGTGPENQLETFGAHILQPP
eukprot:3879135-Amphidinium_carterae.1